MNVYSSAFATHHLQLIRQGVYLKRGVQRACICLSADSVHVHPTPARPAVGGHLYLVSVPIGNTRDITLRAQDILTSADVIAAEDTRRTRALFSALSLTTSPSQRLISCHEHNTRARIPSILQALSCGQSVALVSDAGTPCLSDPGTELVNAAVEDGKPVIPVPGVSASLTALVAAAIPAKQFVFVGFLPRTKDARLQALEDIAAYKSTIVLFEAPHRLKSFLTQMSNVVQHGRKICLARELTKKYEQFLRFESVQEACTFYEKEGAPEPRGEYTIVLGPWEKQVADKADLESYGDIEVNVAKMVQMLVKRNVSVKTIANCVAEVSQVPKKVVYSYASLCKEQLIDMEQQVQT